MSVLKRPKNIDVIIIPRRILSETKAYLQKFGRQNSEGYLCWAGYPLGETSVKITSCVFPPNWEPENSSFGFLEIGIHRAFGMGQVVAQRGELIFAQVHSHPYEAFHSHIDDERPLSHRPGFLSIVVPYFGFVELKDLKECKVFEYLGSGRWKEFSQSEVKRKFIITSNGFWGWCKQWIKT